MKYTIIIPVYNRPEEIDELLNSLISQEYKDFEIIVVEDGSEVLCKNIVEKYRNKLDIYYYIKHNEGPGLTRNYGSERAKGGYYIFFDSDCIVPVHYLKAVNKYLQNNYVDAYGGPDRAHPSFTSIQKAINYSMTSFLTTGGIRGGKKKLDSFHPRSFNMGFSHQVYKHTGGFANMRFGEDVDMSLRIIEKGFKTALVRDAYVYHKRRTGFRQFYKQVYNSGIARINLYLRHPGSLKTVHFFPSVFTIGVAVCIIFSFFHYLFLIPVVMVTLIFFVDATIKNKSAYIGILSVYASFIQLFGYGLGFIKAIWYRIILRRGEFNAFLKNFYK